MRDLGEIREVMARLVDGGVCTVKVGPGTHGILVEGPNGNGFIDIGDDNSPGGGADDLDGITATGAD